MSLKEQAVDEFKRSPIAVTATVAGVLVAFVALVVAWLQYAGPAAMATSSTVVSPASNFHLTNLLLVTSFFLASSLSLASLIHILDRSHPFHAMVLSIPAAVLSAFFSLLVLQLAPPRPPTDQTLELAKDTAFWATLFVFLAINGRSAAAGIVDSRPSKKSESGSEKPSDDAREAGGAMSVLVLLLLVWSTLVSAGITKLVQLFLR